MILHKGGRGRRRVTVTATRARRARARNPTVSRPRARACKPWSSANPVNPRFQGRVHLSVTQPDSGSGRIKEGIDLYVPRALGSPESPPGPSSHHPVERHIIALPEHVALRRRAPVRGRPRGGRFVVVEPARLGHKGRRDLHALGHVSRGPRGVGSCGNKVGMSFMCAQDLHMVCAASSARFHAYTCASSEWTALTRRGNRKILGRRTLAPGPGLLAASRLVRSSLFRD